MRRESDGSTVGPGGTTTGRRDTGESTTLGILSAHFARRYHFICLGLTARPAVPWFGRSARSGSLLSLHARPFGPATR